jgi:menaquinone-9 beta-reductase
MVVASDGLRASGASVRLNGTREALLETAGRVERSASGVRSAGFARLRRADVLNGRPLGLRERDSFAGIPAIQDVSVGRQQMKIAVVGAGPAGATAGYALVSAGHDVTLIDRAVFPRDKICGDWITPGATRALAAIGLTAHDLDALASHGARVRGSLLAAPNARASVSAADDASYCIPRVVFDDALCRRATAAGCRFERREVRDRDLPALSGAFDRVIDARGAPAGRPNSAGLRAYWTVGREPGDEPVAATVQMFADPEYRLGYGWIFPVGIGRDTLRLNVGVGAAKTECAAKGRSLPAFFDRFTRQHPLLRRLRERAVEMSRPAGYPVALAEGGTQVATGGRLRIGDAANLTDPLTGEGIAAAITSGLLVARAITLTPDASGAERLWQQLYEDAFAPDFRVALRLRRMLTSTWAKNAAVWALGRTPRLARRFHAALSGTVRYRDLLSRQH